MNIRKVVSGFAVASALVATVAAPSMATSSTFASTGTLVNAFSYSRSTPGGVTITASGNNKFNSTGPASVDLNGTLVFTGLANIGSATVSGLSVDQALTGGTFTLKDASNVVLLSGTFTGADLTGTTGTKSAFMQFANVTFTGGSYWTTAQNVFGYSNPGDFNLSLISSTNLSTSTVGGVTRFVSFIASGSGQFAADQLVPEPAAVLPFLFGVLGLGALVLRKRRSLANGQVAG
jgi:hypothetical protein